MSDRDRYDGLAPLFQASQIQTDEHGIHRDEQGRRYDAVTVAGELTFAPTDTAAPVVEALEAARGALRWHIDTLRQAAEQRAGTPSAAMVAVNDEAYGAALDAWSTWENATKALRAALSAAAGPTSGGVR